MKRIKNCLILLLVLAVPVVSTGFELKDPLTMEFEGNLEFDPPQVQRHRLSNGIEVFLFQNNRLPIIDVTIWVKAGEQMVSADHAGLADILAYLVAYGGSRDVPENQFDDSLARFGATFKVIPETRFCNYSLHMLAEHGNMLIPLVMESIRNPALPKRTLKMVKGQYYTIYQGRNSDPDGVAQRVFDKLIYGKDSPRTREITPATLANISGKDIARFHQISYRPGNVVIGVSGDFDSQDMLTLLEDAAGDWQEPDEPTIEDYPLTTDPSPPGIYLVHRPGSVQSNIWMGHRGIRRDDPAYPESRLFIEVFGGSWLSRLTQEVREKRGLSYGTWGMMSTSFAEPGIFEAIVATKSESTIEVIEIITGIISDLKTEGITEKELELAKDYWLASFPAYYDDPLEILSDRMSYAVNAYPVDFWDRLPARIAPVTRLQVNQFAAGMLKPEEMVIVVVGDSTSFEGSLSQFGEVQVVDSDQF